MLQMTQIEHPDGSVSTDRCEHISATACSRKCNVVNLFVVSNQLRLDVTDDHTADRLARFDAPNGTGSVNRRSSHEIWVYLIPVERCERRTEIAVLVVVQNAFKSSVWFAGSPNAKVVAAGG